MANVLLLRAPSQDEPDRYEAAFQASSYTPVSIPVLETVYTNLTDFESIVRNGPIIQNYNGVIITSARACDAWRAALQNIKESQDFELSKIGKWSSVPFFVVGRATASALNELSEIYKDIGFGLVDVQGQSSGTSEDLAHFILAKSSGRPFQNLFYLTGDKNRDTLPALLREGGIELHSIQVYATQGSSDFSRALKETISQYSSSSSITFMLANLLMSISVEVSTRWWIVYFAPSAAEFAIPLLRDFFSLKSSDASSNSSGKLQTKIAAIGPTTAKFLQDKLGLHVDTFSPKPTPADLVQAILMHDEA